VLAHRKILTYRGAKLVVLAVFLVAVAYTVIRLHMHYATYEQVHSVT
jgi:hypothetical protein